ncbi:MAG: amidohydrolase family protein [Candidatus Eremiobacteraeota bacterium]|nr:amidohydrolase family protein [Candidatus Eremiobacteraeota bacterium]
MATTLLGPAFIAVGDGTSTFGRLAVEDGRIAGVLPADGASDYPLPSGSSIAPGLIDVHSNGAGEFLFNRDQGNALGPAGASYAARGATGFVAGVMTAPWESMLHAASELVEAANQLEEDVPMGARCLGVHFEGPFLNPKFRRIHRHEWLLPATRGRAQEMVDACKGGCLMVTMAPEVDGAGDAIRVFLENGVVCSAGHTGARYREGMLAIGLGFRSLTHAFNGMPPLDHRDPSILAAFIQDRRTLVQVICDGIHVSPVMIDILHRTLGDRVVLATDNMPAADPGYHIEGGVMRSADGTIAGSALQIDEALRNYMSYAQIPFAQAIVAVTFAPARLIHHDGEMGRIAHGARADLSFWDKDYSVIATMVGGRFVYNRLEVAV